MKAPNPVPGVMAQKLHLNCMNYQLPNVDILKCNPSLCLSHLYLQQAQIYKFSKKHKDSFSVPGSPAWDYKIKLTVNYVTEKLQCGTPAQSHDLFSGHVRP